MHGHEQFSLARLRLIAGVDPRNLFAGGDMSGHSGLERCHQPLQHFAMRQVRVLNFISDKEINEYVLPLPSVYRVYVIQSQ